MTEEDRTVDQSMVSDQIQKIAEEHVRAGRYAEAADLYRDLIARHPDDDSFVLALAWAYHDNGQIEEAVDCFEGLFQKEISRKVFTGFAFDELVRIFKRQGRYGRLLGICERAAAAQPGDYALMGDLADAYLKTDRADRAAAVYRQMVTMEPDDAVVFCNLGNALVALADLAGAEEAYGQAIEIEPEKAAAYFGRLADQYRKAGHADRAEEALRKALSRDAAEPAYHVLLGDLLVEGGRVDEGWRAYETAANLRPASSGAYYYRLGNALAQAADHERAAFAFQKAITAEPRNPFYFLHLAESYAALGREELALEAIRQAKSLR